MGFLFSLSLFLFGSIALNVNGQPTGGGFNGNQLLMGTLVRQGPTKEAVLQGKFSRGQVEEVQGKEVGKSADEAIDPPNELLIGQALGEFEEEPKQAELRSAIVKEGGSRSVKPRIERKKGNLLDSNIQSGRYVANPLKVIGEIKAGDKQMPEILEGEVLAGDAAELDVLTLNK